MQAMEDEGKLPLLQEMYTEWPFFRCTLLLRYGPSSRSCQPLCFHEPVGCEKE